MSLSSTAIPSFTRPAIPKELNHFAWYGADWFIRFCAGGC